MPGLGLGLYLGAANLTQGEGNTVTRYMNAGVDYPWSVTQVNNANTDAGMEIYALYSR